MVVDEAVLVGMEAPEFGYNLLHRAVIRNDIDGVMRLVRDDVSRVTQRDLLGFTPLHVAALLGRSRLLETILQQVLSDTPHDHGADGKTIDRRCGRLPLLHVASRNSDDDADVVSILTHAQWNVNTLNHCGQSALHQAARRGNVNCVVALLEAGCSPAIVDRNGHTAHDLAASNDKQRCAELLQRWMSVNVVGHCVNSYGASTECDSGIFVGPDDASIMDAPQSTPVKGRERAWVRCHSHHAFHMRDDQKMFRCCKHLDTNNNNSNNSNNSNDGYSSISESVNAQEIRLLDKQSSHAIRRRSDVRSVEQDPSSRERSNGIHAESSNCVAHEDTSNDICDDSGRYSRAILARNICRTARFLQAGALHQRTYSCGSIDACSTKHAACAAAEVAAASSDTRCSSLPDLHSSLLDDEKQLDWTQPRINEAVAAISPCQGPILIADELGGSRSSSCSDVICTFAEPAPFAIMTADSGHERRGSSIACDEDVPVTFKAAPLEKGWALAQSATIEAIPPGRECNLVADQMQFVISDPDILAYTIVQTARSFDGNEASIGSLLSILSTARQQLKGSLKHVTCSLLSMVGLIKGEERPVLSSAMGVCPLLRVLLDKDAFDSESCRLLGYFLAKSKCPTVDCLLSLQNCLDQDCACVKLTDGLMTSLVKVWSLCCDYLAVTFPRQCAAQITKRLHDHMTSDNAVPLVVHLVEHLGMLKTENPIHVRSDTRPARVVIELLREQDFFPPNCQTTLDAFFGRRKLS